MRRVSVRMQDGRPLEGVKRSFAAGAVAVALIVGTSPGLSAHRRDEYLQAARIALDPERVQIEIDLTAGIAIADVVIGDIDRDRTGTISADEAQAYAAVVQEAIRLEMDGTPLHVELTNRTFPTIESVRNGEGTIRIELAAVIGAVPAGSHHLLYRNSHHPDIGVYLANVLVPASDRVAVTWQRRDVDQRQLIVDYVLRVDPAASARRWFLPGIGGLFLMVAALWWRHKSVKPPEVGRKGPNAA